jgi:ribonuclease E
MATTRMLIDAIHPEETRVAVLNGKRLEEFDVEVASRKQLKGNIYLAKVIRVEPSLQAAFVDYGGNRHGFLSFTEIHPDYYQIPIADREALVAEHDAQELKASEEVASESEAGEASSQAVEAVEVVGGHDDHHEEDEVRRPQPSPRNYRMQEVIKRRQIILIQVVKDERGNKGASLTTYLSLAGRYCVLMPNTARGGGVSRKITSGKDRDRLKKILSSLEIPDGMGVIVRTAGMDKTKPEIKRDATYLLRLWDSIRELTLKSVAPFLVYEEASLIKRVIRDLYNNDIGEILVQGEEAFRTAKDFMKLLIPSHAKRVKQYADETIPLLQRYQVESQIDATHNPVVQLPAGGYIVINPTEALVSIDVNSGRATRERNIEETALKTNLEAADEVARQLRLRDLAGLIVIDFIDMEASRNNAKVERQLKEAMRTDRARIQLGPISPFGLLELSRQRLRPSLFETSYEICLHCNGTGISRSIESSALHILRALEEEGGKARGGEITIHIQTAIALYILNHQRPNLANIETRYDFGVAIIVDDSLVASDYKLEHIKGEPVKGPKPDAIAAVEEDAEAPTATSGEDVEVGEGSEGGKRRRRRRRRRKKGEGERDLAGAPLQATKSPDDDGKGKNTESLASDTANTAEAGEVKADTTEDDATSETQTKPRRRGRRGGRRRSRQPDDASHTAQAEAPGDTSDSDTSAITDEASATDTPALAGEDKRSANDKTNPTIDAETVAEIELVESHQPEPTIVDMELDEEATKDADLVAAGGAPANIQPPNPPRSGWWDR